MGCFYHYCLCQEARPSLTEEDTERGNKKREIDQMRKQYIKEKGYNVVEMWVVESVSDNNVCYRAFERIISLQTSIEGRESFGRNKKW